MSAMDKSADYAVDFRDDQEDDVVVDDRIGTLADRKAMARLGKEQVFKVSQL